MSFLKEFEIMYVDPGYDSVKEFVIVIRSLSLDGAIEKLEKEFRSRMGRDCEIVSCEEILEDNLDFNK